ncbi:MAG: prepilin-type N-terminal cleavage/methylation domain-containing protein [Opitutaceae bacterium]|nr:prepilin-type N-terminal cleavage/methylation domain-containing protein [Opitutaceae bacterium]NBR57772.1 prepilin-type N-terminal cleavage/methylation domain-containing protein [Opitutaceae bacterium]
MHPSSARSGFTLSELLISLSLGSLLMAAVLSTYLFMGRSMTRTANFQILENKSRLALNYLRQDIQLASAVTTSTNTSLTLTLPSGTVSYTYSGRTLTRTATFGPAPTIYLLMGDCTAFDFNYYSTLGTGLTATALVPLSIKLIDCTFTLQRGPTINGTSTQDGTAVTLATVSPRLLLRNKQGPNGT